MHPRIKQELFIILPKQTVYFVVFLKRQIKNFRNNRYNRNKLRTFLCGTLDPQRLLIINSFNFPVIIERKKDYPPNLQVKIIMSSQWECAFKR